MPMPSNEARRNLLPNEPIESFWDAMWLGIQPFLCFIVEVVELHADASRLRGFEALGLAYMWKESEARF